MRVIGKDGDALLIDLEEKRPFVTGTLPIPYGVTVRGEALTVGRALPLEGFYRSGVWDEDVPPEAAQTALDAVRRAAP